MDPTGCANPASRDCPASFNYPADSSLVRIDGKHLITEDGIRVSVNDGHVASSTQRALIARTPDSLWSSGGQDVRFALTFVRPQSALDSDERIATVDVYDVLADRVVQSRSITAGDFSVNDQLIAELKVGITSGEITSAHQFTARVWWYGLAGFTLGGIDVAPTTLPEIRVCAEGVWDDTSEKCDFSQQPNVSNCDYTGGLGIQQAIESIPESTPGTLTRIRLTSGCFHRIAADSDSGITTYNSINPDSATDPLVQRTAAIYTQGRAVWISGSGNDASRASTIIEGSNSPNTSGIVNGDPRTTTRSTDPYPDVPGQFILESLMVYDFGKDGAECSGIGPCGSGDGINTAASGNFSSTLSQIRSDFNLQDGVFCPNAASAIVIGSHIDNNGSAGLRAFDNSHVFGANIVFSSGNSVGAFASHDATLVMRNITVDSARNAAISEDGSHSTNSEPIIQLSNALIQNIGFATQDADAGYGISYRDKQSETGPQTANDSYTFNVSTGNARNGENCDQQHLCAPHNGSIEDYPFFAPSVFGNPSATPQELNALKKDKGDPAIFDPDGTRSDIGAYGGPGACLLDPSLTGCT